MPILNAIFGRPLASGEESGEKIGTSAGIPIFGLDALSSAAYGPEACLTLLIPLGLAGVHFIFPLSMAIVILLTIVYFSYRQTIHAYPDGGGSYTVARENLGVGPGLLAAAALMIDYILVVAVGISAGVEALTSAVPSLHPYLMPICLVILFIITIVNLRGVKDTGGGFMYPTYLFTITMLIVIAVGAYKVLTAASGHPDPVVAPPVAPAATQTMGLWLMLRAFASGCTALTGVEAVSNGVQAFRTNKDAQRTLTAIIALLIVLLAGIAWLVSAYGIAATDPDGKNYESLLSMLIGAVLGKGIFYYVTIAGILLVVCLSANTAFADFPRLCRIVAHDDYLPHSLTARGRRLVFTEGIWVLAFLAASLLVVFQGVTDRLIPLFAIGAFLAFTLSQAGMVAHWRRVGGKGSFHSMLVNGLGAVTTGITVIIVLVAKFAEGAWITILLIPLILWLMHAVKKHYERVDKEMEDETPLDCSQFAAPLVVVPIESWNRTSKRAVAFGLSISKDVRGLHISCENDKCDIRQEWHDFVQVPAAAAKLPVPDLLFIQSPYRLIISPIVQQVLQMQTDNPGRPITVVIPELVQRHWYFYFLHNMRSAMLKTWLYLRGDQSIVVVNVPWYLD
jgi:amino acid transporter